MHQIIVFDFVSCFPKNPAIADIYTEHAHQVSVAKYAPSGYYIASGGKICLLHVCLRLLD